MSPAWSKVLGDKVLRFKRAGLLGGTHNNHPHSVTPQELSLWTSCDRPGTQEESGLRSHKCCSLLGPSYPTATECPGFTLLLAFGPLQSQPLLTPFLSTCLVINMQDCACMDWDGKPTLQSSQVILTTQQLEWNDCEFKASLYPPPPNNYAFKTLCQSWNHGYLQHFLRELWNLLWIQ